MGKLAIIRKDESRFEPLIVNFTDLDSGEIFQWIAPDFHDRFLLKTDDDDNAVDIESGEIIFDLGEAVVHRVDSVLDIVKIHR